MGDISLSASMRSNLLSLQNTTELMDRTQNRLSTGKKVNSALDNPSSFFTARSLNNRSSDLMSLLDGMGQAMQTLKAAETGLESLTALVEQAKAVGEQALEAVNAGGSGSSASGVTVDGGVALTAGAVGFDADGLLDGATGIGTIDISVGDGPTYSVKFTAGMTKQDVLDAFNGVDGITASYDSAENLNISANTNVEIRSTVGSDNDLATAWGIEGAKSSDTLKLDLGNLTTAFFTGVLLTTGATTVAGDTTGKLWFKATNANTTTWEAANPQVSLSFKWDGATVTVTLKATEMTGLADITEVRAYINGKVTDAAGQMDGVSVSTDGDGVLTIDTDGSSTLEIATKGQAQVNKDGNDTPATFDFAKLVGLDGEISATSSSSTDNTSFVSQYNDLLSQIDSLVGDAGYKGINLLNGSSLTVTFNEDATSSLSLTGVTYDASGLSLSSVSGAWDNSTDVQSAIDATKDAIDTLRSQAEVFGRNSSVIQTRQDFTENMINTLTEGADKLTLADMNEEGANMLALQTRQSLATTSLSMAAQASQSVLSLFR